MSHSGRLYLLHGKLSNWEENYQKCLEEMHIQLNAISLGAIRDDHNSSVSGHSAPTIVSWRRYQANSLNTRFGAKTDRRTLNRK